jgi:hypothetical protein
VSVSNRRTRRRERGRRGPVAAVYPSRFVGVHERRSSCRPSSISHPSSPIDHQPSPIRSQSHSLPLCQSQAAGSGSTQRRRRPVRASRAGASECKTNPFTTRQTYRKTIHKSTPKLKNSRALRVDAPPHADQPRLIPLMSSRTRARLVAKKKLAPHVGRFANAAGELPRSPAQRCALSSS